VRPSGRSSSAARAGLGNRHPPSAVTAGLGHTRDPAAGEDAPLIAAAAVLAIVATVLAAFAQLLAVVLGAA
jgi:hypothetical protein